jgi:surfactin synthase thioesterase subunit
VPGQTRQWFNLSHSETMVLLGLALSLFGHCSGALIAFEVARELRRRDRLRLSKRFVVSQPAPNAIPVRRPRNGPLDVRETLRRIGGTAGAVLGDDELFGVL